MRWRQMFAKVSEKIFGHPRLSPDGEEQLKERLRIIEYRQEQIRREARVWQARR